MNRKWIRSETSLSRLAAVLVLVFLGGMPASGSDNLIVNGDFSVGLSEWTFREDSFPADGCPEAWAEAYVADEQSCIHGHYAYGLGVLRQGFPEVSLTAFSFGWQLDGDCTIAGANLYSGDQRILQFGTRHDITFPEDGNAWVALEETTHEIEEPLEHGSFNAAFNYTDLKASFTVESDKGQYSFSMPISPSCPVDAVELWLHHHACDGRNDGYGYFDNVVLVPEPAMLSLLAMGGLALVRCRRR